MPANNYGRSGELGESEKLVAALRGCGYARLGGLHDSWRQASWRGLLPSLSPSLEVICQAPEAFEPHFAHPRVLAIASSILGSGMQLDTVVCKRFALQDPRCDSGGQALDWHRDRFGYEPLPSPASDPHGLTFITYLQKSDAITGPLRVVPGSHRDLDRRAKHSAQRPRWGEELLEGPGGEVLVMDNRLIHSGSPNWSARWRYYVAATFTRAGLPRTDTHRGAHLEAYLGQLLDRGRDDIFWLFDPRARRAALAQTRRRAPESAQVKGIRKWES